MLYFALQKNINLLKLPLLIDKLQIGQWLYFGEDSEWRIKADESLSKKISRISIADQLEQESWRLREPFIDAVGILSKQNDSLAWWASEIPTKDPYNTLYLRICLFSVAKKLMSTRFESPTLIVVTSPALIFELMQYTLKNGIPMQEITMGNMLTNSLNSVKKIFINAVKSLPPVDSAKILSLRYSEYLEANPFLRKKILEKNKITIKENFSGEKTVLFFTYINQRNFSPDGLYQDPNFGRLPFLLKDRGYQVAFIARILNTIPFEEAVLRLRDTEEMFYFPENFIERSDFPLCEQQSNIFSPNIPDSFRVADIPVCRLMIENLKQTRETLKANLVQDLLIRKFVMFGIKPERILYTYEGQSWENTLLWSVRHYLPDTKTIAYDNVTFSKMYLSKFHSPVEYKIRPQPYALVTNGPLSKDILIREGSPPEKVRSGCALRHSYLWDNIERRKRRLPPARGSPVTILVATSIGYGESLELILKTCVAFGGDSKIDVLIKCHPLTNVRTLIHDLGKHLDHPNISISDAPVSLLLESADVLLYTTTSVCYEALLFGVPPVCIRLENFLTLDRLDIVPEIRWIATTPDQIREVIQKIIQMDTNTRQDWEKMAYEIVKSALAPIESDCIDAFLQ